MLNHKSTSGFTLIELLIVILIISIISGVAILSIGNNSHKQVETLAKSLAQTLQLAQEQALLEPATLGFSSVNHQLQFLRYGKNEEGKSTWGRMDEEPFRTQDVARNLAISIKTINQEKADQEENKGLPEIIFSPSGNITPFEIYLGQFAKSPTFKITGGPDGKIAIKTFQ